jgi:hypothetical protein
MNILVVVFPNGMCKVITDGCPPEEVNAYCTGIGLDMMPYFDKCIVGDPAELEKHQQDMAAVDLEKEEEDA